MHLTEHQQSLLAAVEQSPAAVAIHDKAAWLAIFASVNIVEDPVGGSPHISGLYDSKSHERSKAPLNRFYETYIAPNTIRFEVKANYFSHNEVIRDLNIHIQMSDKVSIITPMHLRYQLVQEHQQWKVAHLAAHWEVITLIKQLLANRLNALPVISNMAMRQLKYQGVTGSLGFAKAFFNVGEKGKQTLQQLFKTKQQQNHQAFCKLFNTSSACINSNLHTQPIDTGELFDLLPADVKSDKIIAAGDIISCSFYSANSKGVLFLQLNTRTHLIHSAKYFSQ